MPEPRDRFEGHTPGLWEAQIDTGRYGGADISIAARTPIHGNPIWIARAYNSGVLAPSDPEREANAHLIAAAPDLLALAREAREVMMSLDKIVRDILTDSQLDTRLPCGQVTVRHCDKARTLLARLDETLGESSC